MVKGDADSFAVTRQGLRIGRGIKESVDVVRSLLRKLIHKIVILQIKSYNLLKACVTQFNKKKIRRFWREEEAESGFLLSEWRAPKGFGSKTFCFFSRKINIL